MSIEILTQEEQLVAELERLGIRYLSRQTNYQAQDVRPPWMLLVDLIQQPSSRIRTAVIAVLLARPEYAQAIPTTLERLQPRDRWTLKLFYTAAVLLQKEYAQHLRPFLGNRWQWLPDWFSSDFGLNAKKAPRELLRFLGLQHRQYTDIHLNWMGTYVNVAQQLLRRWELENLWNR